MAYRNSNTDRKRQRTINKTYRTKYIQTMKAGNNDRRKNDQKDNNANIKYIKTDINGKRMNT